VGFSEATHASTTMRARARRHPKRGNDMRFYNQPHRFYCGVDLHARSMYLCIRDHDGAIVFHQDLVADANTFLKAVEPYRDGLVVGCECMFAWYWLADLCHQHQINFVLGHALYLKAIHGGKSKNDKLDADKLSALLRGGNFPLAYVYPKGQRETRDLLRRRSHFVRQRGLLVAHIQNTNSQYNLPVFGKKLVHAGNREDLDVAERFTDPSVRLSIETDLALIDQLDERIHDLELHLERHVKIDDANTFHRLRSIPGVGKILALVFLYEIHRISRFPEVGAFLSYSRLVRGKHESAGKSKKGSAGSKKIGNAHLRWAFGEAVCLWIRSSDRAKAWMKRHENKRGKAKAMAILAAKLARAMFHMLVKKEVFDEAKALGGTR
jgi:transposase